MSEPTPPLQPVSPGTSVELIHALNAIALTLQRSIHSEENVFHTFQQQVVALGLRGGISELDASGDRLIFRTVAFTNPLRRLLRRFERQAGEQAQGFSVAHIKVDVYHQVISRGQAIFVADTGTVSAQVIPAAVRSVVGPLLALLGRPPGIFAPLIYDGQVRGMLNMVGPNLTAADLPTLQAFANQITVALENTRLVRRLESARDELEAAYDRTLEGWIQALDLRDRVTEGHTLRTASIATRLARHMDIPEEQIPHLNRGALLHDIGKMGIPDNILLKPGPLNEDEWRIMKQHPQMGYNWVAAIDYLKPAAEIPLYHHEHWDGSGYGRGLKGAAIPLPARIFAVVDVWDAMRSDRPYRRALPEKETLDFLRSQAGKMFDPDVVRAFFDLGAKRLG